MDPGVRNEKILVRLREVMEYAYETSPFYKKKWDEAGIRAAGMAMMRRPR